MTESLALVDIHQVRWTHNAIYDHFKDGRSIFETVVELLTGNLKLSALPPLQLVKKGKQLYSLSNRRLFVLRKYAHILKKFGHLHEKSPVSVPIAFTDAHHGDAFTTGTGGLQVQLLRPLQKPTFQPRQWGPTCAPSARSLSRDARSHSRGRSLSVGRWAEATEAGRGAATGRRASFGRVEYRFVLEDIEEIPPAGMAAVAPSSGRPRSPSPKAKAAATEVKPKAVAKEVKPKAVAKEVKPKAVAKDMKPKVAKDVEDHMPDALKDIGPCVSEAQGFPVLPQSKRSKKELEVADLVLKCLRCQKEIPKARQIQVPENLKKHLFSRLVPSGEEQEVTAWIDGRGPSIGPHTQVEKLLKDLQRYVARLETQVRWLCRPSLS